MPARCSTHLRLCTGRPGGQTSLPSESACRPDTVTAHTTDPDGRYVVIEGMLDGAPLAFAAIYTPNSGHSIFFDKITPALLQNPHVPTIWGGDFNSVLEIDMDRSNPPLAGAACFGASQALNNWFHNTRVHDAWRLHHPLTREYSFTLQFINSILG